MAKIYFNIEAESAADFHDTLRSVLRGQEPWAAEEVSNGTAASAPEPGEVTRTVINEPATAPGVVALPEVKEAQVAENARVLASVEEAVNPELDAHGHPWSAALHASTKSQTKEGLWRMKPGVERPAPVAGYPKEQNAVVVIQEGFETYTGDEALKALTPVEQIAVDAGVEATSDEDEFAAFKTEAPEAPAVPEREWTDADLSKLCNQAATKMGSPDKIKELIAVYVSIGAVPHSRNIPVEDRERFAGEVEALADIKYEG